jgi:hypothetical protein
MARISMKRWHVGARWVAAALAAMVVNAGPGAVLAMAQTEQAADPVAGSAPFIDLLIGNGEERALAIENIVADWQPEYLPMALETIRLAGNQRFAALMTQMLRDKTGEDFGLDLRAWWRWVWNEPNSAGPAYASFKSQLYRMIDPKFGGYFAEDRTATVRLDEVVWGGVRQDGIPPLRQPAMIAAAEADYLGDDNVVFGLAVNGDVRAYPKRILGWHEMFVDEVGGINVAGVYCTLCGTMILYKTEIDGIDHALGTSGFLYRSNKLMYDQATQSLWNTIWGRPVIGPLAGTGIELERMSLVTTTWGEWRRRHPDTKVLSLATGHARDYSEGAAYRAYFATDDLMFAVPELDDRLKNKDEVLGLVFADQAAQPLAISAAFLQKKPVHHDLVGELALVVLTDRSGANRVYETNGTTFADYDGDVTAVDESGLTWMLEESGLVSTTGLSLPRLPAHRAFWFGWYSAYSNTRLVM